jgi:hypothetical protein
MEATYFPGQGEHATAPLREAFRIRMGKRLAFGRGQPIAV